MSFSDHKITQFTHRISELADQPNMPADELKARFDSSPEELRQSVNGICDDAARLEARVEGIVVETFGDTIDKEMLSDELTAELDAKATQTALASETAARESAVSAEASARQSADNALSNRVTSLETALPQKARVVYGTYTGNDSENRAVSVGFAPKLVYICRTDAAYFYGLLSPMRTRLGGSGTRSSQHPAHLTASGFTVSKSEYVDEENYNLNRANTQYGYVAIG